MRHLQSFGRFQLGVLDPCCKNCRQLTLKPGSLQRMPSQMLWSTFGFWCNVCSILGHVFHHDPKKSNLTGGCLQYLDTVYLVVLWFEVIIQNQICININCYSRVSKQLNSTCFARFMEIFRLATTTPRSASDRLPCMRQRQQCDCYTQRSNLPEAQDILLFEELVQSFRTYNEYCLVEDGQCKVAPKQWLFCLSGKIFNFDSMSELQGLYREHGQIFPDLLQGPASPTAFFFEAK